MLVPIALECLVRIDSMLRGEPSPQSWVTGEHLVGTREAMVGEEIAALMCDCVINQANEGARSIRETCVHWSDAHGEKLRRPDDRRAG